MPALERPARRRHKAAVRAVAGTVEERETDQSRDQGADFDRLLPVDARAACRFSVKAAKALLASP
jgi:hypothetical protein